MHVKWKRSFNLLTLHPSADISQKMKRTYFWRGTHWQVLLMIVMCDHHTRNRARCEEVVQLVYNTNGKNGRDICCFCPFDDQGSSSGNFKMALIPATKLFSGWKNEEYGCAKCGSCNKCLDQCPFFPLVQRRSDVSGNGHRNLKSTCNAPWSLITERIAKKLQCLKLSSPWQPGRASVCLDRHHPRLCQHAHHSWEPKNRRFNIILSHSWYQAHIPSNNKVENLAIWPLYESKLSLTLNFLQSLNTSLIFFFPARGQLLVGVGLSSHRMFRFLLGNAFVIGFHPSTCKHWTRTALVFSKKKKTSWKDQGNFGRNVKN